MDENTEDGVDGVYTSIQGKEEAIGLPGFVLMQQESDKECQVEDMEILIVNAKIVKLTAEKLPTT